MPFTFTHGCNSIPTQRKSTSSKSIGVYHTNNKSVNHSWWNQPLSRRLHEYTKKQHKQHSNVYRLNKMIAWHQKDNTSCSRSWSTAPLLGLPCQCNETEYAKVRFKTIIAEEFKTDSTRRKGCQEERWGQGEEDSRPILHVPEEEWGLKFWNINLIIRLRLRRLWLVRR